MLESDSGAAEAVSPADDLRADLEAAIGSEDSPGLGHNNGPEMETDRSRDSGGRFASTAPEVAPEEGVEAKETQEGSPTPPDLSKAPERPAKPDWWPSDAKFQWDKLHPTASAALKADLDALRQSIETEAKGNTTPDPVSEVVRAYQPQFSRQGLTPDGAVKALFEAQAFLERDPVNALKWLSQSYGVNLETLAPRAAGYDGTANAVISELQGKLARVEGYLTKQEAEREASERTEAQRTLASFSSEKAADGQLARPHFSDVQTMMAHLLNSGLAESLEDAYDKATLLNPTIRQRMQETERKATAAREEAERKRVAEDARRKAGSVRTNPSVQAAPASPDDLRSALEAAFNGA